MRREWESGGGGGGVVMPKVVILFSNLFTNSLVTFLDFHYQRHHTNLRDCFVLRIVFYRSFAFYGALSHRTEFRVYLCLYHIASDYFILYCIALYFMVL